MDNLEQLKIELQHYADQLRLPGLRTTVSRYFDLYVPDEFYNRIYSDDYMGFTFERVPAHHTLVCVKLAEELANDMVDSGVWDDASKDLLIASLLLHDTVDYSEHVGGVVKIERAARSLRVDNGAAVSELDWADTLFRAISMHRGKIAGVDPNDCPAFDIGYQCYNVFNIASRYIPKVRRILI